MAKWYVNDSYLLSDFERSNSQIDVKLAQPRFQRDAPDDGGQQNFGGGNAYGNQQQGAAYANAGPAVAASSNTPFDPQALAALYTRMFQITGAGGMNQAMMGGGMGGMNPAMMGAGGYGGPGGMGGGMQMGRGMSMGRGMGGGMGGMGMGGGQGMGTMGRGAAPPGMMGNGGMNQNIPRGPRGAPGGPGGVGGAGVGPQRAGTRGHHSYHPYAR